MNVRLTVLIPTLDERASLRETVQALIPVHEVEQIILVTCEKTLPETISICEELGAFQRVCRISQDSPGLGGAFRAGIARSEGSHILTMFADLESDPRLVPQLVSESKLHPASIISASRWIRGGKFEDYRWLKLKLNRMFQRLCEWVFQTGVTDFTYGYRLYPAEVLKETAWAETDHAFVVESILVPRFQGITVREIPAVWRPRWEGAPRSRYRQYVRYLPTCMRLYRRLRLQRQSCGGARLPIRRRVRSQLIP